MKRLPLLLGLFLLLAANEARAFLVEADPIPIDRLAKNGETYVRKNPDSADAHYTLSRIHYVAFSRGVTMAVGHVSRDEEGQPSISQPDWHPANLEVARNARARELALIEMGTGWRREAPGAREALREATTRQREILEQEGWTPANSLPVHDMVVHATVALRELDAALKLDPQNVLSLLGLASLKEQILDWIAVRKPERISAEMRALDYGQVAELYLRVFRMAFARDGKRESLPPGVREELLSYEAAHGFIRQFDRSPKTPFKNPRVAEDLEEVRKGLAKLESMRVADDGLVLVSPVVFSLQKAASIIELLAPQVRVDFDLVGHGLPQRWPWLKASTGLLVWDPERRGEITSGRQLFGNYTFQIFRRSGYEALAALDDDGDGMLRGSELAGVRVWFDANSDGRSEPGEVHDLSEFNIVAIAARAQAFEEVHPMNPQGIVFGDGSAVPSWDWMTAPAGK